MAAAPAGRLRPAAGLRRLEPGVHLFSQAGGRLRYDDDARRVRPRRQPLGGRGGRLARAATSTWRVPRRRLRPPARALAAPGWTPTSADLPVTGGSPSRPGPARAVAVPDPDRSPAHGDRQFVDLQRDVTVADLARATGAGLRSVEHVKRYTTAGTAHDQGKTSGVLASGIVAELLGVDVAALGTTTFRPPYTPVSFAALAGRDRGALHDPVRVTALHDWHVAHGALFENVGQWKRPWYYPQDGEDMEAAVLRECRGRARRRRRCMDASTLGKIDVQGPDAGGFLDRLYTNMMSTLKVGSIRYGVMCRADGMVFDDGTVIRLAEDRFLVTTTTGNAAAVLDWMEEWLQTEWPELRVHCTSVTEQWATVAAGRAPLARGARRPSPRTSPWPTTSFPFMTWRDADGRRHPGPGLPDQLLRRAGLRGQRAARGTASPLWEALYAAGAALRHHPVRHRDHARAAGREGLPDHRPGHRRHGHPAGPRHGLGGVEEEGRLHRQAVLRPRRTPAARPQAARRPAARRPRRAAARGRPARRGRELARAAGPDARPRHLQLPQRGAGPDVRARPGPRRPGAHRADRCTRRSATPLVPVTVTDSVLFDKEGSRRDG